MNETKSPSQSDCESHVLKWDFEEEVLFLTRFGDVIPHPNQLMGEWGAVLEQVAIDLSEMP